MNSIPKFAATVVIFMIAVLVCISMIFAGVMMTTAQTHHKNVISTLEESAFDETVIANCIQKAENKGYNLTITKEINVSSVEHYKVVLLYNLYLPLFGKVHTGEIVGYAYPGALLNGANSADHYFEIDNNGVLGIKEAYRWATGLEDYASDKGKDEAGSKNDQLPSEIVIPTYFDGKKVVALRDYMLANNTALTKLTFEEGVQVIGESAFMNCTGLTEIAFPDSMIENGYSALKGTQITSFKAPFAGGEIDDKDHSYIGYLFGVEVDDYSYQENNSVVPTTLKKVELTKYVAYYSLYDLDSLTELVIGEDVTEFEPWPFAYCDNLTSVTIPKNVQKTHYGAFSNCKNLKEVVFEDGSKMTLLGHSNFEDCTKLATIDIPDTVKEIGAYCFENCDSLTFNSDATGKIPGNVEIIGEGAFSYCDSDSFTTLEIPASVTKVDPRLCTRSTNVKEIKVAGGNNFKTGTNGELLTYDGSEIVQYPYAASPNYVVPNTVKVIRKQSFYYTSNLENIDFSNATKLTTIGYSAFGHCANISSSIVLPNSVTTIDDYAFYHAGKWEEFTIGANVTHIGTYAFYDTGFPGCKTYMLMVAAPVIESNAFFTNTTSGTITKNYLYVKNNTVKAVLIDGTNYRSAYTEIIVDGSIS